MLSVHDLRLDLGGRTVLDGIALNASAGEIVALVGPNGCGKTSLLRCLLGRLAFDGIATWDGRAVRTWRPSELARRVAHLPQSPRWDGGASVIETLRLGRVPHLGAFGLERPTDAAAVERVVERLALTDLLGRPMGELSGGQRQRVLIGRALVQEPAAVLLDEPDTYLDLSRRAELASLIRTLAADGLLVLMASHDLAFAAGVAHRVGLMTDGRLTVGEPTAVLTAEALSEAFGLPVVVRHDPFHVAPA